MAWGIWGNEHAVSETRSLARIDPSTNISIAVIVRQVDRVGQTTPKSFEIVGAALLWLVRLAEPAIIEAIYARLTHARLFF